MTTGRRTARLAALAITLVGGSGALAQSADPVRVDAGTSDVGPLAESLRLVPVDLRVSDGFESVFSVTDEDGRERFYRRDGAILAVFPRSDYVLTGFGPVAAIPAGTWFLIGDPTGPEARRLGFGAGDDGAPAQSDLAVSRRIDLSAGARPAGGAPTTRPSRGPSARSDAPTRGADEVDRRASDDEPLPWQSDRERGTRVATLLSAASSE